MTREEPQSLRDGALHAAFGGDRDTARDVAGSSAEPPLAPPPDFTRWPSQGDRFELLGPIAHGGFGTVVRARDKKLGREIALKLIKEPLERRPQLVRRLIEEAQVSSQLQHPGVVPVYDYGLLEEGRPYIAMKLVRGRTLKQILADRDEDDHEATLLPILERLSETIAYVHDRGVIHRDLKPSNVMVGRFGEVQVMDWGLAKSLVPRTQDDAQRVTTIRDDDDAMMSVEGSVIGTPAYMAPEQARGEVLKVDTRADVFALGAILFETLTGAQVHAGETDQDTVTERAKAPDPGRWRSLLLDASVDDELASVALACLAPDRNDRLPDASAVAERISAYRESVEKRARAAELELVGARARARSERRARRLTVALTGSAVLVFAIVAAVWMWREQREAETRERISSSMTRARALWDTARAAEDLDPLAWQRAMAAVGEAESAVDVGVASQDLVREVADLKRRMSADAGVATGERALRDRLEEIMTWMGSPARRDRAYREAFADAGVDIPSTDSISFERWVQASRIRGDIGTALDDWGGATHRLGSQELMAQLRALRDIADEDPVRKKLRALFEQNDPSALRSHISTFDVTTTPPRTLRTACLLLLFEGDSGGAADLMAKASATHPGDFWIRTMHGHAAHVANRAEEALPSLQAAVALRPGAYAVWVNLGATLSVLRDHAGAVRAFRRALAIRDDVAATWSNLGRALADLDRLDDAERALLEAIRLDAKLGQAHAELARLSLRRNDLDAAVPRFLLATKVGLDVRNELADTLRRVGRGDDAAKVWSALITDHPEHRQGLTNLGWYRFRTGDRQAGERLTRRAYELEDRSVRPAHNLAVILRHTGRAAEAVRVLRNARQLAPRDPTTLARLGAALMQQGDLDTAEALLRTAAPDDRTEGAQVWLAETLLRAGRFAEAERWFERGMPRASASLRRLLNADAKLARARRLSQLAARGAELARAALPAKADDCVDVARVFSALGWTRDADRAWRRAFEIGSATDLDPLDIESAVQAAVARGSAERRAWGRRTLSAQLRRMRAANALAGYRVTTTLGRWLHSRRFAAMRGRSLEELDEDERSAWTELWSDVEAALEDLVP